MSDQRMFRKVPDHQKCMACDRTYPLNHRAIDVVTGLFPCGHDAMANGATVTRNEQQCHIIKIDTWLNKRSFVSAAGGARWMDWTPEAQRLADELLRRDGNDGGRHRYSFEVVSADPLVALFTQPTPVPTEQG